MRGVEIFVFVRRCTPHSTNAANVGDVSENCIATRNGSTLGSVNGIRCARGRFGSLEDSFGGAVAMTRSRFIYGGIPLVAGSVWSPLLSTVGASSLLRTALFRTSSPLCVCLVILTH